MKNNEYNIVNVTNEKNNFSAEYTKAQNVEYSFQPENKNTIKDELNDNSTVNDKVEDNLSKKAREKEEKKEKKESEVESSEQLSSSSSSSAASSSGASSTASSAASSTAAASSGGVAHAVVAAATVSVAAVGAVVGVVVVAEQKQDQDLITFTSSEIGTNSVDFTFRMPAKLLAYNQDIVEPDQPIGEKAVIYTVKDSTGVVAKDNLQGAPIGEDVFEYNCTITGLTADTAYALTIDLEEQIPDKEPVITQLAERTFRTKAIGPLVTFNSISATSDYVAFSFIVDNATVGFDPDPESQITPAIRMTVSNSGYYDEQWLESYEQYSETQLICYGDFSGLTEQTTYTLTIQLSTEGEVKELGSTTFTTEKFVTGFEFLTNSFEITSNSITFAFDINEEQVDTSSGSSNIAVTLTIGADYVDGYNVTDFTASTTSGKLTGSGTFRSLSASTTYTITISNGTTGYTYGSTTVTTSESTTEFNFLTDQLVVGYSYISFAFEISESEVEQASGSSNINALLESGDSSLTVNITSFEESSTPGILIGRGAFTPNDGVTIATSYTLSIVNSSSTTYGSTSVRTMKATIGPINTDIEGEASFALYIDSNYVGYVEGSSDLPSISASAVRDGEEYATTRLTTFSTYSSSVCKADGTIIGLEASTTYMLYLYYNHDGISEVVANKEFTSKEASLTFYFAESQYHYIGDDYIQPLFYIKKSEVQEVTGATASGTNINVSISGGMAYTQTINIAMSDFSEPQDTNYYMARPNFENLDSNIEYTIVVSNTITGENYGSISITTTDTRGIGFVISTVTPTTNDVQASFYLNTSYVSDTNNVSATVITKEGTSAGSATARLTGTEDSKSEFSVNVSGLDPQTDYTIGFYYNNTLVGIAEFTTEESTGPSFNGATIPTEVSFYSHQFTITLDFVDDPDNPQFDMLSIQLYNRPEEGEDRELLGSLISLESTTEPQVVTLPHTEEEWGTAWDFDLNQIGSFDILATQVEIYSDTITFVDTDTPGRVTGVSNQMDCVIYSSPNDSIYNFYLALQIEYTDDYDKLQSFYISVTPDQAGAEESGKASIIKTTNSQQAVFEDSSSSNNQNQGVIEYINNGGTNFTVNIYNFDNQSVPIYTQENVTIAQTHSNMFYNTSIASTEFSEDDYEFRFDEFVYLNGDPSNLSNAQIVFINESSSPTQEEYKYNLPLGYPSYSTPSFSLMDAVDQGFQSYSDIVSAFSGKTFEIVIRFMNASGTAYENYPLGTGVSFTFN